jgi:hypothetical protein
MMWWGEVDREAYHPTSCLDRAGGRGPEEGGEVKVFPSPPCVAFVNGEERRWRDRMIDRMMRVGSGNGGRPAGRRVEDDDEQDR